jgi:hypothetical protein
MIVPAVVIVHGPLYAVSAVPAGIPVLAAFGQHPPDPSGPPGTFVPEVGHDPEGGEGVGVGVGVGLGGGGEGVTVLALNRTILPLIASALLTNVAPLVSEAPDTI